MSYSREQVVKVESEARRLAGALLDLNFLGLAQSNTIDNSAVREKLRHGVGRRLQVLQKSIEQIFSLFPMAQERPLSHDTLTEVQIYLHSFVINLAGVFDNWAWAFVHRHDLLARVGGRFGIGLFKEQTQQFLPGSLRDYLTSPDIARWHLEYLKEYRDALAHRIPLYIPPAAWTDEDTRLYESLEQQKPSV